MGNQNDNGSAAGVALRLLATAPRIRGMVTRFLRDNHSDLGLNIQEFDLLRYAEGTEIRMGDLASLMAVTPSAVTKIADGLVARRLVERFEDPGDRRVNRLRLRPKGAKELARVRDAVSKHLARLTGPMPEEDRALLSGGLDGLLRVMEEQAGVR
jgi:DNA-binding MarR family transcriptional regulator